MSFVGATLAAIANLINTHSAAAAPHSGHAATAHGHAHSALSGIDTDSATTALHHTVGAGATQAAAGNHAHTTVDATTLRRSGADVATGPGAGSYHIEGGSGSVVVAAGNTGSFQANFARGFVGTPTVVATLTTGPADPTLNARVAVVAPTTTTCQIYLHNDSGASMTMAATWLAFGS